MGATNMVNECYSSGVKIQTSVSSTTTTAPVLMTVKGGGSVCYLIQMTYPTATPSSGLVMAFKNPSGASVATLTEDTSTATTVYTVTCPGGVPTVVDSSWTDSSCGTNSSAVAVAGSNTATCTSGACTF
jgi:hypothetical protein